MSANLLPIALRFLQQGISVVPTANDGSKRPAFAWQQFQHQLPTAEQVINWFDDSVQGIGVITGKISGNLEMLELEGRAVANKMHVEIRDIAHNSGLGELWIRINDGYVEMTPSGGIHWLYRVSDADLPGNTKLARKPGENGGVDVWAETRSEGGFTITAPSGGPTHPSGGSWKLIRGTPESIPTITSAERAALHSIFSMFDEMPKAESVTSEVGQPKTPGALSPGDDFNEKMTWDEILKPLGWTAIYNKGEATVWRRPGKNEGISATTNFNGNGKLYVFSTSTVFDSETSYSKFAAFAHLNHGGDFKSAAANLRNQGYGAQGLNSFDLSNTLKPTNSLQTHVQAASSPVDEDNSTWKPVELKDYYDGLFQAPIATILKRTDGAGLIYQGRVHSIYGESESGKSWIAQIATAELLKADKKVIYIDFESDALDIVNRLKGLGVSRANLLQYFTYVRPDGPRQADDPYWLDILEPNRATLVVIDGVTESLTMWGGETKDNDAITRWMRIFPRTVATASGAAVVLIDHITKNAETRGRFAIGGQAKLATIDGAAYLAEPLEVLAPGKTGSLTLRVTKDRPGFVRKASGMYRKSDRTQEAAIFTIDSTRPQMQYVIGAPRNEEEMKENHDYAKAREIIEFVASHPGCNRRAINAGVKGDDGIIKTKTDQLMTEGMIENRGNERSFILYVTAEAREEYDLEDATILQFKATD